MTYNPQRHTAVKEVELQPTLAHVIEAISQREGVAPLIIVTSARAVDGVKQISYNDHAEVWQHNRPVLIVFGTGRGLAPSVHAQADYVFDPIYSFYPFNHLSVRSAAAIILDRWLGIQVQS